MRPKMKTTPGQRRIIQSDKNRRYFRFERQKLPDFAVKHVIPEWRLDEIEAQRLAERLASMGTICDIM